MLSGLPAGCSQFLDRISAASFEGDAVVGADAVETWRTQLCFRLSVPWTDLLACAKPSTGHRRNCGEWHSQARSANATHQAHRAVTRQMAVGSRIC